MVDPGGLYHPSALLDFPTWLATDIRPLRGSVYSECGGWGAVILRVSTGHAPE
jgi:hypothetical protein